MKWEEVKNRYSNSWLLIEALKAETKNKRRNVEEVNIIKSFDDSRIAYKNYQEIHRKEPERELYVVYSNWDVLSFEELNWKGLRGQY